MPINLSNLFNSQSKNTVLGDFQDLEHLDGLSLSAASAKLYENKDRDDVALFYFRHGANHASVFTRSKIVSENIKWNTKLKNKSFLKNAPKSIVAKEKIALKDYKIELKKLNSILNSIKN